MFTGIITDVALVKNLVKKTNQDLLVTIALEKKSLNRTFEIGCSIACSGVCLTLVAKTLLDNSIDLEFEISAESISKTNISTWKIGDKINLEFALRAGDELGGHMVSGHVDGVAKITKIKAIDGSHQFIFELPTALQKFICPKGSITINGISLTVNEVGAADFSVNIIPHTFVNTNLQNAKIGDLVNLEIDVIARYLDKLLKK